MIVDAVEHIREIGFRVIAVHLGSLDDRVARSKVSAPVSALANSRLRLPKPVTRLFCPCRREVNVRY